MLYDLRKDLDVERIKMRLSGCIQKGAVVEFTDKSQRTPKQNNYLHLVLGAVALHFGEQLEFVKQEYFKRLVNPDIFVTRKNDKFLGDVEVLGSTRDTSSEDMSKAIDRFKRWAYDVDNIYIPEPGDADRLRDLEIEMSKSRWL